MRRRAEPRALLRQIERRAGSEVLAERQVREPKPRAAPEEPRALRPRARLFAPHQRARRPVIRREHPARERDELRTHGRDLGRVRRPRAAPDERARRRLVQIDRGAPELLPAAVQARGEREERGVVLPRLGAGPREQIPHEIAHPRDVPEIAPEEGLRAPGAQPQEPRAHEARRLHGVLAERPRRHDHAHRGPELRDPRQQRPLRLLRRLVEPVEEELRAPRPDRVREREHEAGILQIESRHGERGQLRRQIGPEPRQVRHPDRHELRGPRDLVREPPEQRRLPRARDAREQHARPQLQRPARRHEPAVPSIRAGGELQHQLRTRRVALALALLILFERPPQQIAKDGSPPLVRRRDIHVHEHVEQPPLLGVAEETDGVGHGVESSEVFRKHRVGIFDHDVFRLVS